MDWIPLGNSYHVTTGLCFWKNSLTLQRVLHPFRDKPMTLLPLDPHAERMFPYCVLSGH
jgi:hypothetical protein